VTIEEGGPIVSERRMQKTERTQGTLKGCDEKKGGLLEGSGHRLGTGKAPHTQIRKNAKKEGGSYI